MKNFNFIFIVTLFLTLNSFNSAIAAELVWQCRAQCFSASGNSPMNLGIISGRSYSHAANTRREAFNNMIGHCQQRAKSEHVILAIQSAQAASSRVVRTSAAAQSRIVIVQETPAPVGPNARFSFRTPKPLQNSLSASSQVNAETEVHESSYYNSFEYSIEDRDCRQTPAFDEAPQYMGFSPLHG